MAIRVEGTDSDLTDMPPEMLNLYSAVFQEAHNGPARWGLSVEVGTRRGGSALMFLLLLDKLYEGFEKPLLITVDPYGFKPYVSGKPGVEDIPIYGDPDYLAMKSLLAKWANHSHFKLESLDFFYRMQGSRYWFPGAKAFTTKSQPGEFALGEEKKMGNVTFCLLDGDHSARTIQSELGHLWGGRNALTGARTNPWMHPAGIVCVDNAGDDPKTIPALEADYNVELKRVADDICAIVRGPK